MPDGGSDCEVFADDLSECSHTCEDELSDVNIDDSEEEVLPLKKRVRVLPPESDSEMGEDDEIGLIEMVDPPGFQQALGAPGVKVKVKDPKSIAETVALFIGDDLFQMMAEETNRYRSQNADKYKQPSKALKWKDVNIADIKKMLGLILVMGHIRKDYRNDYWSTDPVIETPMFSKVMSRDRFNQIWTSWHFANNELICGTKNRLFKVQPVLDYLLPKFNSVYKPQEKLSLSESIIPWQGKLSFRLHKSLNRKYGILVRIVCESTTGYICNLELFSSKSWSAKQIQSSEMDLDTEVATKANSVKESVKCSKGDQADQYLSYYSILTKTKKWTKRVVMYLLNCALFNAFRVYKVQNRNSRLPYPKFLLDVAKLWISEDISSDTKPGSSTFQGKKSISKMDPPGRLSVDMRKHETVRISSTGKKKYAQRQCRVCASKKKKSLSCYMCKFCKIPLHRGSCFHVFHTKVKY